MNVHFSALLEDPRERFGWSQPVGLPATYVINPQGELVETLFGPQTRTSLLAIIGSDTDQPKDK